MTYGTCVLDIEDQEKNLRAAVMRGLPAG